MTPRRNDAREAAVDRPSPPGVHRPVPLAIVGGGAAGLFAAAVAASRGLGCLVLERKARIGSKMLMTANGRCNFTKDIPVGRMLADIGGAAAEFLRPALEALPPAKIVNGFRSMGLATKRLADGRVFPATERASDVVHVFGDLLRNDSVPLLLNCPVTAIASVKNGFIVSTRNFTLWARKVLLATGGMSFPKTGSTGDGHSFARALGHRIEPCRAGLTGFETGRPQGTGRHVDAVARVIVEGKCVCERRGEVEFESWGVGGAAVYNCQRHVALHLDGRRFQIELEFDGNRLVLDNPKPRPLKESIVTIGGVALDEVDPLTMESRLVGGLHFAGELLDVDGPTGGYNLTIAFATARLAVEGAMR